MRSYHDTTEVKNFDEKNAKAKSQEVLILELFRANPNRSFTWRRMADLFEHEYNKPIDGVSCKRAITNLTNRVEIKKLGKEYKEWSEESGVHLNQWILIKDNLVTVQSKLF